MSIIDRLQHGWNAFVGRRDPPNNETGFYYRPDRPKISSFKERTIINSVYNRMALDASMCKILHVRVDENDQYEDTVSKSTFNEVFNVMPNIDQSKSTFLRDLYFQLLDEGCIAICPVETDLNPDNTTTFKFGSIRVGKIVQWYPSEVKVDLYNDRTGRHQEVLFNKKTVAIIENPFYAVMNEPNGTLKRLLRKLSLLDFTDEQQSSGKLDLILQLPYLVKSDRKKEEANRRVKNIETQLAQNKYGIAYIDGTEKITQLNRSLENNLLAQVEYLTKQLFAQLNINEEILNGTANEDTMANYMSRTIEPILEFTVNELKRKWLTKTARTQGQTIKYFMNPFRLAPITKLVGAIDVLTRSEILSTNEVRKLIGFKPSDDPQADELRNKNINASESMVLPESEDQMDDANDEPEDYMDYTMEDVQNGN